MGWFQPGGAGTAIYCYDDADTNSYRTAVSTTNGTNLLTSAALFGPVNAGDTITGVDIPGGTTVAVKIDASNITMSAAATGASVNTRTFARVIAVADRPHNWNGLNLAYSVDFPRMQDAAGNFYTGTPRQYLPNVLVTIGNPAVAGNATSFVDTSDASVFVSGARLAFTTANPASTSFTLGTQVGTGERMTGKNGGSIHMSANLTFRGTVNLFGTTIHGPTQIQLINGTGSGMTVAGCGLHVGGSFVLGNSNAVPMVLYNNNLISIGAGNIMTLVNVTEGAGNILGCTTPNTFMSVGTPNLVLSNMILSGAPIVSDLRTTNSIPGWAMNNIQWSDTVGIPRVSSTSNPIAVDDAIQDFRTFDTKVVDDSGNSLPNIPILITSDAEGRILDDTTDADGNVTFTWNPTGVANVLPVRDYYFDAVGNPLIRDRTYVMAVNTSLGSFTPDPLYHEQFITFEWPGRDRFGTGYALDGGSFTHVHDIIQLVARDPGTQWIERVAP